MESKYQKLNDYLNEYCLYYDDYLYMGYISEYVSLSVSVIGMLARNISIPVFKDLDLVPCQHVSLMETIGLCREFMQAYLPSYSGHFDEWLRDGVIDFLDDEDSKGVAFAGCKTKNGQVLKEINAGLAHTLVDSANIIHEYMHQMNYCDIDDVNQTTVRTLFTEAVSIYFETLMFRFLEEKGYSKKEVAKAQYFRVSDYIRCANGGTPGLLLLRDYHLFGKIADGNFDEAMKLHLLSCRDKKTYQRVAESYERGSLKRKGAPIGPREEMDFFEPFRYVLGTTLAYWAISQNDSNMPWKWLQFNEDLIKDRDLDYAFSRFCVNPFRTDDFIHGAEKEVARCYHNLDSYLEKKM